MKNYLMYFFLFSGVIIGGLSLEAYILVDDLMGEGSRVTTIANSSSMIPMLDKNLYPNIQIKYVILSDDEDLEVGKTYIYHRYEKNGTVTGIIHLLDHYWIDPRTNKTKYFFKGLNNKYIDPAVSREMVKKKVTGVIYE